MQRLDLGLNSHPKEFRGNAVRTYVSSKEKIPSTGKKFSLEKDRTHNAASSRMASPAHDQRVIPAPTEVSNFKVTGMTGLRKARFETNIFTTWPLKRWYDAGSDPPSSTLVDRLVGLVVKASASGTEDPGLEFRLRRDFSGSSHTSDFKIGTPCQAPGVTSSVLGLVGPVSVYCDWVR